MSRVFIIIKERGRVSYSSIPQRSSPPTGSGPYIYSRAHCLQNVLKAATLLSQYHHLDVVYNYVNFHMHEYDYRCP